MQGEGEGGGAKSAKKMQRDKINMLEEGGGESIQKKYEEIKNMHYMK